MKNFIYFAVISMIMLVSCENYSGNKSYNVTVVENKGIDLILGGNKVSVVTKSGDTLEAFIQESLLFNNELPFSAVMEKNEVGKYGAITDTVSDNKFEVTVVEKSVPDSFSGNQKCIALTKSGMKVECFISDEILLNNAIPFKAKMHKDPVGRYGFIN